MEDLSGKHLGSYQLLSPLGQGGMAAVYKAFQPSMDRCVAIKILPRHLAADPDYLSRFQREAKLIAQLQHPHIIPVFDFGESDGFTFLTMPLIKGDTLADRLKGRPLPFKQVESFISQIGDALDYAHTRGVIHRDVKPSNILIDERGNCVLADFGVAKIIEIESSLTQNGVAIGTPAYMSPEQSQGDKTDYHTDIYSLGVVLYEMVTGVAPFQAETPAAVLIKQMMDPIIFPKQINPSLPESVENAILKAMAKKPEDRFDSAGQMVTILKAAFQETSSNLRATGTFVNGIASGEKAGTVETNQREKQKKPHRSWPLIIGIGLLFLALSVGIPKFLSSIYPHVPKPLTQLQNTDVPTSATATYSTTQTLTVNPLHVNGSTPTEGQTINNQAIRSQDILTLSQPSAKIYLPRMSIDLNGVLHVVWKEQVGNQTNLIHRELLSDGKWTEGENLLREFGSVQPQNVQLVTKPSGGVCALFDTGLDQWYRRCLDSNASNSSDKEASFLGIPAFAGDVQDNIIFLKNSTVYKKILFDNQILSEGEGNYGPVDFVVDPSGKYHAVWLLRTLTEDKIVYRQSPDKGNTWSNALELSLKSTTGVVYGPKLFLTKDGQLILIYLADNIYVRRWSKDSGWGEVKMVPLAENDDPRLLGVGLDSQGLLRIVFQEYQGMKYIAEKSSGTWTKPTYILDSSVINIVDSPQIAINSSGSVFLLWAESGDHPGIHFVILPH